MQRRDLLKGLLAAPVMPAAAQEQQAARTKGLPPLTIKDVKVITTSGGRNYRWVFLKIITSEAVKHAEATPRSTATCVPKTQTESCVTHIASGVDT